jgi:L-threonylcarbamoyladenylate synthase
VETIIFNQERDDFEKIVHTAAKILQNGGLVVFPTETVYGIGANAFNINAAKKIYEVKGRPSDNPLIIHIASKEDASKYADTTNKYTKKLMDEFWPGPLTLVLPKKDNIPTQITGGLNTVAIRYPSYPLTEALIKASGLPICAPSANKSGTPSSTAFSHVYKDLFGKVDMIIDGGTSIVGLESTVLDVTTEHPIILRPGYITKKMIEKVLDTKVMDSFEHINDDTTPKAPGMKYRHYAPKGTVILLDGTAKNIIDFINKQPSTTAFIGSDELIRYIHNRPTYNLGSKKNLKQIAKNIFLALRKMDELGVDTIYIEAFEQEDLGAAIMNRLLKAASGNIIKL